MTPDQLRQLAALAEARKVKHLADLEAAMAEDRRLAEAIEGFARAPAQDMADATQPLPFAQTALRHAWAEQNIALARKRRADLAIRIAALRKVATRSLGMHEAIGKLTEQSAAEAKARAQGRREREAMPPEARED
jgi:hypothetical protein